MSKVVIIGLGHIGSATIQYLKADDLWYKNEEEEVHSLNQTDAILSSIEEVEADFWIVAVPGEKDGKIDTSIVDSYVERAKKAKVPVVVRTTLPIGYNKDVIYWPSFITDYNTEEQRIVMSYNGYDSGFCKLIPNGINFLSLSDAILVKLYSNAILATRAELFNNIADKAENIPGVINAICQDNRIGNFYNYPERKRFGGKCFIKDLDELAKYDSVVEAVNNSNRGR